MALDKILSIGGKPGLYKLLTQTRGGFVGESLLDGKRVTVGLRSNVSVLSEIAIYTLEEELPLKEVFQKIKEKEDGKKLPSATRLKKLSWKSISSKCFPIMMRTEYTLATSKKLYSGTTSFSTTTSLILLKTKRMLKNLLFLPPKRKNKHYSFFQSTNFDG